MKRRSFFVFLLSLTNIAAFAIEPPVSTEYSTLPHYILNNRILAKVNNKPITVLDVVKKMDIIFYRELPEQQQTPQARYQFYTTNWRYFLRDIEEEELIVADATEKKMTVNDATVREEIERTFGPDVYNKIASIGFSYQEVWDLLYKELTMEKMMGILSFKAEMVTNSPNILLRSYQEQSEGYQKEGSWLYQAITFRSKEPQLAEAKAQETYHKLANGQIDLQQLAELSSSDADNAVSISISKDMLQTSKEIAPDMQKALSILQPGQYSQPLAQISRLKKQEVVYRILYLKQQQAQETLTFETVQQEVRKRVQNTQFSQEKEIYLRKLRNYFAVEEYINPSSDHFEPFVRY